MNEGAERAAFGKAARRLIPLLFGCYIAAFLDRVNVGFAKLQMAPDLALSDAVYGFGAGIFFIGYFLFEVPSNLVLEKLGARRWIARIMVSWGLISVAFLFTGAMRWGPVAPAMGLTDAELTFYVLRFLLGVAEAGFFPGVILYLTYWFPAAGRAQIVASFMSAIALSNLIGSPLSAAILQFLDGAAGWRGWQWLFLIEGLPSVVLGLLVLRLLPDGPRQAPWLSEEEKDLIQGRLAADHATIAAHGGRATLIAAFADPRVWALAVVYFCGACSLYAVSFWMPTIVSELGIAPGEFLKVGLLNMIPWGFAAVAMLLWARRSDRLGERRWHAAAGYLTTGAGLVMLAVFGGSPLLAIAALTAVTVGTLSAIVTFWSLPTAFLSGAAAAAGIAWINSVGNLGGHVGPDMIGRIRTAAGGEAGPAFLTLAGLSLLAAVIVLALPRPKATP